MRADAMKDNVIKFTNMVGGIDNNADKMDIGRVTSKTWADLDDVDEWTTGAEGNAAWAVQDGSGDDTVSALGKRVQGR